MSRELIVATANTHEAEMLRDSNGLKPFMDRGVDVILMQEVLGKDMPDLGERLDRDDYTLASYDPAAGLAIAVSKQSEFQPVEGSERHEVIQPAQKFSDTASNRGAKLGQRLRPRGLVATKLSNGEDEVTVASTHPIVFVLPRARARQVQEIGRVLQDPYYQRGSLIVGGDMNHYPGPRPVDVAMRREAGLKIVELGEPTWRIRGTRHEWAAKIGSRILRRELDSFDGELDAILYKGLTEVDEEVIQIASDHDAVIASFEIH